MRRCTRRAHERRPPRISPRRATVAGPRLRAYKRARPPADEEILLDPEASEEGREALEALREMGWGGAPIVTHYLRELPRHVRDKYGI